MAVQIKVNRELFGNENYSQRKVMHQDASHSQQEQRYSVPAISKAVFSISKNDQVSAATHL